MKQIIRERLAQEICNWGHEGLINPKQQEMLARRYQVHASLGHVLLRWLGFFALFMLGSSLLGLIGMALGPAATHVAPFVIIGFGAAMWWQGVRFATEPLQRYPISGSVLLTAAFIAILGGLAMMMALFDAQFDRELWSVLMLLTAGLAATTAYRYGLRWPLGLAILMAFHALGNWHAYGGRGSYFLGIADERVTAVVAACSIALAFWHEHQIEHKQGDRWLGFGRLYMIFGLLYLNMSFWFLSIHPGTLGWVIVFTLITAAQVAIGAGLRDGRILGFGVVFLGINVYTRYFEYFWDEMSKGSFFMLAGIASLILAAIFERQRSPVRGESS